MIIVSGCPRSGTSLTMLLMSKILGEDRILGDKFPREFRVKQMEEMLEKKDITKRERAMIYNRLKEWKKNSKRRDTAVEHSRMMNPNGFWEDGRFSVSGLKWQFRFKEELEGYLTEEKSTCIKIVSQGLIPTDPRFIGKIVYLIRHPRNVAKSQENLVTDLDQMFGDKNTLKMHTPKMYLNVTAQASRFFLAYPNADVKFVLYDDLISNPEETVKNICEFIDEDPIKGWEKSKGVINPSLNRSKIDYSIENKLWDDSEKVYELFLEKKYQEIIDLSVSIRSATRQENTQWVCSRSDMGVNKEMCESCRSNPTTKDSFKKTAMAKAIDWRNQPCLFECGMDLIRDEDELLSIEESIEYNFWEDIEE